MAAEIVIRTATEGDADQLAHVHRNAWRAAYRGVMTDEYLEGLDAARMADTWRRNIALAPDGTTHLVAEMGGTVVGFASLGPPREADVPDAGQLYAINVDPGSWTYGVGSALFAAAEQTLADAGYSNAYLWVEQGNARAISFYSNRGWRDDGGTLDDERFDPPVSERRHSRVFGQIGPR